MAYADLLQVGRIGLWQAVLHFDAERGVAFSTYAVVAIQRRMWRASAERGERWPPTS
jgi:DNA-directed RNA polymerase specialized sigma subunit